MVKTSRIKDAHIIVDGNPVQAWLHYLEMSRTIHDRLNGYTTSPTDRSIITAFITRVNISRNAHKFT